MAFGNDQTDIELFEKALYAVQIGDFPALQPYADDQLVAKQNQPQAVAAKILQVSLQNSEENKDGGGVGLLPFH